MKKKNRYFFIKERAKKLKKKLKNNNLNKLIVYKTSRHMYAKIISIDNKKIEISASTTEKKILKYLNKNKIYSGNKKSAELIGKIIAERSILKSIKNVFFDRSGFKFHGRIKSLADSSRLHGLKF